MQTVKKICYLCNMYKSMRIICIAISALVATAIAAATLNVGGFGDIAGQWLANMQIIPAVLTATVGWLVLWFVVTVLFGRIYCSTACPLGFMQDASAALSRLIRRRRANYRYRRGMTAVRVLAVLVIVEAVCLGISGLVGYLDPYSNYVRVFKAFVVNSAAAWAAAAAVVAVVMAVSWRNGRLLCNTICPVGALMGAVTKVSILRFDINPDLCTQCGECERVCKAQCVKQLSSIVDNSRCVSCFNCVAACPNNAITWRIGRHRLQWPLMQRLAATNTPTAISTPNSEDITTPNHETISRTPATDTQRGRQ